MSKAAERLRELAEIAEWLWSVGFPATPDELQDAALLRAVADWLDGHGSPKRYHSDRCDLEAEQIANELAAEKQRADRLAEYARHKGQPHNMSKDRPRCPAGVLVYDRESGEWLPEGDCTCGLAEVLNHE